MPLARVVLERLLQGRAQPMGQMLGAEERLLRGGFVLVFGRVERQGAGEQFPRHHRERELVGLGVVAAASGFGRQVVGRVGAWLGWLGAESDDHHAPGFVDADRVGPEVAMHDAGGMCRCEPSCRGGESIDELFAASFLGGRPRA